jgi:saccharopine dehydrogenase-like NADP-dependent oxidoreductase
MRELLLLGAGKIGSLIACLLAETGDYDVCVGEADPAVRERFAQDVSVANVKLLAVDAMSGAALHELVSKRPFQAIVSSLPYYCNPLVAKVAREFDLHYFDLTEDVEVMRLVRRLAEGARSAFVPQCGLAPGVVSIIANDLMRRFEELDIVKLRVGALPVHPSNALKYSLTWSTDGLINEYGNVCYGIENGVQVPLMPLEGYETIEIDGLLYEGFNTSGGLGTLADTYAGRVRTMNYKTLRYPGHCEKIHFLMQDLRLNQDRATLKRILEAAVPKTLQDVVLIYVSVSGKRKGELFEENYVKKIYPQEIGGKAWSAIQATTASAICTIIDLVFEAEPGLSGFVAQESFGLSAFLNDRFGRYYR